jgi:hypothetical protein
MNAIQLPHSDADFDFIIGDWRVHHRRLRDRLVGCTEWLEFEGSSSTRKILGGRGNVEDNLLHLPEGAYRAAAFRSLDVASGNWAIWWLDGRSPHHLDTPVIGRFEAGQGNFYAEDTLDGRPIRVRFLWLPRSADAARWEQAFSVDAGQTWETNWTMDFERIPA